jgi:hypothetical protein
MEKRLGLEMEKRVKREDCLLKGRIDLIVFRVDSHI